jgi:hypothetical protein
MGVQSYAPQSMLVSLDTTGGPGGLDEAPDEEGQAVMGGGGLRDAWAMSLPARRGQYPRQQSRP